jgi:hypothetical protein
MRVYTRVFHLRDRLDWSDKLLIASALDALGLIVCDTLTFQMGVMDEYAPSEELSKASFPDQTSLPRPFRPASPLLPAHASTAQISFASNYFYDFGLGLPKLSMLAFYWASFNLGRQRTMRRMLWSTTAFVVACYLTSLFDDTFFCGRNVSVQWSQEDGACSVFYAQEPFILNFSLGLACYLAIYAVPMILLVQGSLKTSAGVMVTFAFGALAIALGTVRFICLKVGTGQENLVCEFFDCLFHYPFVCCIRSLRCLCRSANGPSHQW